MDDRAPAPEPGLPAAPPPLAPTASRGLGGAIGASPVRTSLAGKAVEAIPLALLVTLVPRVLGPADYGHFASALVLVTVGSSALAVAGAWLAPRYVPAAGKDRAAVARALARRLGTWYGLQLVGAWAIAATLLIAFPDRFPLVPTLLVVTALSLDLVATLFVQLALGMGRFVVWSFRFAVQNSVLVAAALVLHEVAGTTGAVAAVTVASGFALAYGASAVAGPLRRARPGMALPAGAIRFAALQGASELLDHTMYRGGVVAVALLAGSAVETGFAALTIGVATGVIFTIWQLFAVQLVVLVERAGDMARAATRIGMLAVLVVTPCGLAVAALREPLLVLLAGEEFRGAKAALGPALAALPLVPLAALASQSAALAVRPGARLLISCIGLAAFASTAVLAVPSHGALGGTLALLAGIAATGAAAAALFPQVLRPGLLAAAASGAGVVLLVSGLT